MFVPKTFFGIAVVSGAIPLLLLASCQKDNPEHQTFEVKANEAVTENKPVEVVQDVKTVDPATTAMASEVLTKTINKVKTAKEAVIQAEKATVNRMAIQVEVNKAVETSITTAKAVVTTDIATVTAAKTAKDAAKAQFDKLLDAMALELKAKDNADVAVKELSGALTKQIGKDLLIEIGKMGGNIEFGAAYLQSNDLVTDQEIKEVTEQIAKEKEASPKQDSPPAPVSPVPTKADKTK